MRLGIVGLPNVGKSTLFNALTKAGAEAANYPFSTKEANFGVVAVPDQRLKVLHEMYNSKKTVYTSIEFYDIAGLVRGASKGEGLGNKFLGHIRQAAAIIHVVRCFEDENVVHVGGKLDPAADIETVNVELILADMETIEKRIERTKKNLKGDKSLSGELDVLNKVMGTLENGLSARTLDLPGDEMAFVKSLELLSFKPVIYVANISENDISSPGIAGHFDQIREFAESESAEAIAICAKIEAEVSEFDDEERYAFLGEMGIAESGLDQLIRASYHILDLISFLTAGEKEVRAWTIRRGTKAHAAAGKIHSDIEKGFIRAETIAYDKLIECGGNLAFAKEKGLVKAEGKEYIVKDGDVMHFLFNV
ncbi:MAG: redox-regulated ATPase YchF [Clostridiales bacterium]|nr:redox-regulated ATPase YchF [Clostridiales bacterium]